MWQLNVIRKSTIIRKISILLVIVIFTTMLPMFAHGTYENECKIPSGGYLGNRTAKITTSDEYRDPPEATHGMEYFVVNDLDAVDGEKIPKDATKISFATFLNGIESGNTYYFDADTFCMPKYFHVPWGNIVFSGSSGTTFCLCNNSDDSEYADTGSWVFSGQNVYVSGIRFEVDDNIENIITLAQSAENVSIVDCDFAANSTGKIEIESALKIAAVGPVYLKDIEVDASRLDINSDCVNLDATGGPVEVHVLDVRYTNNEKPVCGVGLAANKNYNVKLYFGGQEDTFRFIGDDRPATDSEYQIPWRYVSYCKCGLQYDFYDSIDAAKTTLGANCCGSAERSMPCYDVWDGSWLVSSLEQIDSMKNIIKTTGTPRVTIKTDLPLNDEMITALNSLNGECNNSLNLVFWDDLKDEIGSATAPKVASAASLTKSFQDGFSVDIYCVDFTPTEFTYDSIFARINANEYNTCKFIALPKELKTPTDSNTYVIGESETSVQLADPYITKLYSKTGIDEPTFTLFSDIVDWDWSIPDSADASYISVDTQGKVTLLKRSASDYIAKVRCQPSDYSDFYRTNSLTSPYVEYQIVIKAAVPDPEPNVPDPEPNVPDPEPNVPDPEPNTINLYLTKVLRDQNGNRIGDGVKFSVQVLDGSGNVVTTVKVTANGEATMVSGLKSGEKYFVREMLGEHFKLSGYDVGAGRFVEKEYVVFTSTLSTTNSYGNIYITLDNMSSPSQLEIMDEEIPLAWPPIDLNDTDIIEIKPEEIPLANGMENPKTGDDRLPKAIASTAVIAFFGTVLLVVIRKRMIQ